MQLLLDDDLTGLAAWAEPIARIENQPGVAAWGDQALRAVTDEQRRRDDNDPDDELTRWRDSHNARWPGFAQLTNEQLVMVRPAHRQHPRRRLRHLASVDRGSQRRGRGRTRLAHGGPRVTLRPCATCGVPSPRNHCDDHTPKPAARHRPRGHVHANPAAWKRLSARARKAQPWCLDCGSTTDLCGDHIIPVSEAPELALEILNVAVRCRPCNGRRGNNCTDAERQAVHAAIRARKARLAKFHAAQRENDALPPRGDTPTGADFRSARSRDPRYTPGFRGASC